MPRAGCGSAKEVHPKRQFSAKVGTVFEDSPLGLDIWFTAIWMIANCKNGVSSYEVHRALGITQKVRMVCPSSHSFGDGNRHDYQN